jgi:ABC-type xylose transport system permease subunit
MKRILSKTSRPIFIACACIIAILVVGAAFNPNFLSPNYLLLQLEVASFLGIVAAGAMLVILLGHIDLSIPWTITLGGMMSTAVAHTPQTAGLLTLPVGLGCGVLVGLINGIGIAWLRVPSMIFTLGMNAVLQGLVVLYTGGSAPASHATKLMSAMAVERTFGIPNSLFVWGAVSLVIAFLLRATQFGRYIYAVGNRERAAYLSGFCGKRSHGGVGRDHAHRVFYQSLPGNGRRLSITVHRRNRLGRNKCIGRQRELYGNSRRRSSHRAATEYVVSATNARSWTPDHLRRSPSQHALTVWPRRASFGMKKLTSLYFARIQ